MRLEGELKHMAQLQSEFQAFRYDSVVLVYDSESLATSDGEKRRFIRTRVNGMCSHPGHV
jgi:hypothetical protein